MHEKTSQIYKSERTLEQVKDLGENGKHNHGLSRRVLERAHLTGDTEKDGIASAKIISYLNHAAQTHHGIDQAYDITLNICS